MFVLLLAGVARREGPGVQIELDRTLRSTRDSRKRGLAKQDIHGDLGEDKGKQSNFVECR